MTNKPLITGDVEDKLCLKCDSENIVKNGSRMRGGFRLQSYKCNDCGYAFDEMNGLTGKKWKKEFSLLAYKEGLSFVKIAKIIDVNRATVSKWVTPEITDEVISLHAVNNAKMTPEKEENLALSFEQNQ